MNVKFVVAFLLAFAGICSSFQYDQKYSAIYDAKSNKWAIVEGVPTNYVAWGVLHDHNNASGWYIFEVKSNPKHENHHQAYAAGLLEGALTQQLTWYAWLTYWNGTFNFTYPASLQNWLLTNDQWARKTAKVKAVDDGSDEGEFWSHVDLVYSQLDGLFDGYNSNSPSNQVLTYAQWLLYQASDEYSDIQSAIAYKMMKDPSTPQYILDSHCSVLIKLTEDGQNLFSAHVTWSGFSGMLRIYKHYSLPFNLKVNPSYRSSFSSGPGYLVSGDDWYLTNTNMAVMETTNNVFNMSLYQYVTTNTVLYWVRVLVANRMASSGSQWSKYFAMYNSGTYNNQWIIVDYKLFKPGQTLQANTLWIAEQIPGWVISEDKTDVLSSTGYWGSYNIPYFPFVYNISGYPAQYAKYGNGWSYTMCPRAQIFRRDQHTVVDLRTFKHIMRYNKWQTDPLSQGDSCNGISARCDLDPPSLNPSAFGGIDCKLTNSHMSVSMHSKAVSGPTWDSQPVFAWTEEWRSVPHYGQPNVFDFDFVDMRPSEH